MRSLKHMIGGAIIATACVSVSIAQTKPTPAEQEQWAQGPQILESSPCKKITWLLEAEAKQPSANKSIRLALGWWGRGFIEGEVYIMGEKAQKSVADFGLSVDVVAAHISSYCYDHPSETPVEAVAALTLKALK